MLRRLRDGDWRTALLAVAAGVLTAFVVAELVSSSWLLFDAEDDFDVLSRLGADWLLHVCSTVGSAFWSPILVKTGFGDDYFGGHASAGVAPLTVTVAALGAYYLVLRRAPRTGGTAFANAVRAAMPFGLVIGLVSFAGRHDFGGDVVVRTTFPEPALYAFVAATLVGMLAYRDLWAPLPRELRAFWDRWWFALRGALAGLGAGLGASALVVFGLYAAHHERLGGWGNVGRAVPTLVGFLPNAAVPLFGVSSGGRAEASAGLGLYVSLYHRYDLSAWYWLLVLLPVLAVAVSVRYVARRRGDRTDSEVLVVGVRVAVAAATAWWALAVLGRMTFGAGLAGLPSRGQVGASLFWGMVTVGAAFALLGWLMGLVAVRRYPVGTDVTRAPRPRRVSAPPYVAVLALAVLAVALAGAGSAIARDNADVGERRSPFDQAAGAP